ncbi:DUF58 domain-containing protein [Thermoleptolyngbya oregonensis NK1-22]|uniref:DUF58 domain-containing protein n=1 Tax=Thermoleptolyngbya oregonensis NK1-22 TaxID=2547457 RepID=A0AA97BPW3_9CYAN|nr:DUF58 domain-containing protein [Thermoleptolyngbya oregonensis]WOB43528.1 DUF58 domain-containing protein [Thermoleptolyngbya oregonensis NK1-22]
MLPAARLYQLILAGTGAGLAIALLLSGQTRPSGLAIALGLTLLYDGVVLGLGVVDAQRGRSRRVSVARRPLDKLSIGRENPVHLTVTAGNAPALLKLRDDYPANFGRPQAEEPLAFREAIQCEIAPQETREITYTVFPKQRGVYAWGDLYLRQLGPWGLAWHDWRIPQAASVAVYPDLMGLRELSLRLTLQTSGNIRRARRMGMGTEFTELRDYSTGDDLRFVDWKATARKSRLLMRVLEPEQEQTLVILLDRGRLMTAQVAGLARFDWALNAALALALAGLHRGDRVGVGVFDRQMHAWIPPERGAHQLPKLLAQLTPIEPVFQEPDYLNAVTTVAQRQTRRALVVLLTDIIDQTASAELFGAMAQLAPRYLPFCVALRDRRVDDRANHPAEDVQTAYSRAVALDLLAQRQLALAKLKQRGVLILDAPADRISTQLVDRYLQLKARNLL